MKKKWPIIKDWILYFLAVSKILHWMGNAQEFVQNEHVSTSWAVLERILSQELPLALMIVCIAIIENIKKANLFLKLAIGYVACLAVIFGYIWILSLIFAHFQAEYFYVFISFSISYAMIAVILNIKEYFQNRSAKKAEADKTDPAA
jgi:hypothetical protein